MTGGSARRSTRGAPAPPRPHAVTQFSLPANSGCYERSRTQESGLEMRLAERAVEVEMAVALACMGGRPDRE